MFLFKENSFVFKCPPIPIPIPGVSQGTLPGATNMEQNGLGDIFCDFLPPPIPILGVSQSSLPGEKI